MGAQNSKPERILDKLADSNSVRLRKEKKLAKKNGKTLDGFVPRRPIIMDEDDPQIGVDLDAASRPVQV